MSLAHKVFAEAEKQWRDDLKRDFPIRGRTVVSLSEPKGRDWFFFTDMKTIFAQVAQENTIPEKFEELISKHWDGNSIDTLRHTFKRVLWHETYHSLEAPFSTGFEGSDDSKVTQAIHAGVKQALPELSEAELLQATKQSRLIVMDIIADNRFYVDNLKTNYVPEDIIPTWNYLELYGAPSNDTFFSIFSLIYGNLYGPQSTREYWTEKATEKGKSVADDALSAILQRDITLPEKKPSSYELQNLKQLPLDIRRVFSGNDRYNAVTRLMNVLAPYVTGQGGGEGEGDGQGESHQCGGMDDKSLSDIMKDVLDGLDESEQMEMIEDLTKDMDVDPWDSEPVSPDMKELQVRATHEYYKRKHPKLTIIGGNKEGESLIAYEQERWHLKDSKVLTKEELSRLNLANVAKLQHKSRLPWLIKLDNGLFRFNEYDIRVSQVKGVRYIDQSTDVPDITEFYLDSSGSMFIGDFQPNDKSSWDMLSHVMYGLADALQTAGTIVGKKPRLRIHNLADYQISSKIITVDDFLRGDSEVINILFQPNNGYSRENLDITDFNHRGKSAYVAVTDGQLVIPGRTERESRKMINLSNKPNTTVSLFEIGGTYSLGEAVSKHPQINYYQVHDIDDFLAKGAEVLLTK